MSEATKSPPTVGARAPVSWAQRLASLSPKQRELAEMKLREQGIDLSLIEISPRPTGDGPLPLSFAQQRLWFLHQLEPASAAYNLIGAMRLEGDLKVEALHRAYRELSRRHEMLRTTFTTRDGAPVQIIHPHMEPRLPVVDLSGLGRDRRDRLSQRFITRHTQRPFDLAAGPLMSFALFRHGLRDHALSQSMHHIVSDAWSMDIFRQELLRLYRGLSAQPPVAAETILALPKLQYADFAVWQRKWLQGEVLERQLSYWRGQLGGGVQVLELPTDRPRAGEGSFRGGHCVLPLDSDLIAALDRIGGEEKTTRFVLLCCLFEALLWRTTGQTDFTIGSTIAGRNRREIEELIGFFINTRVLRADFSGQPSYRQAVRRVRRVVLDADEHQDLPFERLVEELAPERSLQRPPLFQVTFTFLQRGKDPAASEGGLQSQSGLAVSILGSETSELPFDLTLRVEQRPEGLGAVLEYRSELFDHTRMRRLLDQYGRLLAAAVVEPDRALSQLSLLSAAERQQTLVEWNDCDRDRSAAAGEGTVHGLFAAQVARNPAATAVRFAGESLTYGQLEARSSRLARRLLALGVVHNDAVGLLLERSLDMVVAVVAILKAGAGYLPLDPGYPADRLAFMVEDAGMSVLVTRDSLAEALPESGAKLLRVDADGPAIAAESAEPLALAVSPESLCYAIFTSGSTGRPKGTLVTHRAVHNRMLWLQESYRLADDDRVLQKTPISFDVSVWEIFWPLTCGASIVLARPDGHMDAAYLLELLLSAGVTTLHFVPSMLRIFLAQPGVERLRAEGRVRRVVASGEALTFDLQQAFFERFGRAMPLHNMYGPSEAARASFYPVDPTESHSVVPIGRPVANGRIYLVDSTLRPVPLGVPGELTIGGIGLARGYHRRAGLTAEKFLPDPFATEPGARLYRTGDLTRTLPTGAIEFLGRIDHQVKVRGMRVELGEINAALENHPAIRDAVVVVREVTAGDQRLVAYLVAHDQAPPAPELRRFLAQRLPDYMLPTSFAVLEAMPLTPSGKVDRKALPALDGARPELESGYVAPTTALQTSLAEIFATVLQVDQVGIHDDFFALGGHSLLATQIVSRVRDDLSLEVPLRTLFETPTVADWAEAIEALSLDPTRREVPPLVAVPRSAGQGVALSFAQQRLWFLDRLVPDNPFYNMFTGFRLIGAVDLHLLDRVFQEIVRRHEILRTVFVERGDEPLQVLLPEPFRLPLPTIDLSGLVGAARDERLGRLAHRESQRTFNLATGPLLRVHAVRLAHHEWALLINIHHINSDGWSTGVFYRELIGLYRAFAAGESSPFEPLAIQYADFALWQRGWLSDALLDSQVAYWSRQLADAPRTLSLPTDHRRPEVERFVGGMESFLLEPDLVAGLKRLGQQQSATLFMTTLALFDTLLYRYSGQGDILVGSGIANRTFKELEGLIGFFVNTLVMRTRIDPHSSFLDLLVGVRDVALEAYAHQDLPFERLIDELKIERNLASNPLCQVGFVVQNYPIRFDRQDLTGIQVAPLGTGGVDTGTSKFDLTVYLRELDGWISCGLEYSSDLFDRTTVRRMGGHFAALVASAVEDPSRSLLDLPMLDLAERQQLVGEWARVERPYPRQATIPDLFAEVVRRRPDARALTCATSNLTYGQLNRAANRLAHRLRREGVAPETRVAVGIERSADLVVAILAILKAGGVYVPLDLSLPESRLSHILEQADPALLVVRSEEEAVLPGAELPRLTLAAESTALDNESDTDPEVLIEAENLAYIVFTSGSTGRPKGVGALHRGIVRLVRGTEYTSFGEDEVFAMLAPPSFDASTFELWAPLLNGGELAIYPAERPSLEDLGEFITTAGVTTLWITVGLFHQMADVCLPQLAGMRQILTGGDVVSPEKVAKVLAVGSGTTMINCYGPTENTTFTSSIAMLREADVRTPLPIGTPIAQGGVLVLDRGAQPTPVGVVGALFATGDGLARGYVSQPGLTAERFVPNPFAVRPGERMYDTGDRASWSIDGLLNFHGRDDNQVKIRGFRIELEEIERALCSHSAVRDAAVLARRDEGQGKRLVAYVVQDADYVGEQVTDEAVEGEQVDEWGMLFDDLYRQDSPLDDPTFNIIGWDSTYTGEPLPVAEMREWLDDTIERIASEKPRRIFEIGCGTGMLLFRLAPSCERYLGTDLSQEAIQYLTEAIGDRLPQVTLACQPADIFEGIEDGSFDTLILNSVVQYFPTAEYLADVIAGAQRVLAPGGRFFLGDLRSQPLNEPFATDIELLQASEETALDKLRLSIQRRLAQENELTVSPAFFAALKERIPALERVEIHPKFGKAHNELTAYRYQAVLRFSGVGEPIPITLPTGAVEMDGRDGAVDLDSVRRQLTQGPALLVATGLPNARVTHGVEAVALLAQDEDGLATVGDLRQRLLASNSATIDPADLAALAVEVGYELELGWPSPGADGRFDAVLRPTGQAGEPRLASWLREPRPAAGGPGLASYCSRPLQGRFLRGAVPALRAFLGDELPDYMVPSLFVLMDELPLNATGKIDRRALPDPRGSYDPQRVDYVAPRSEFEVHLAAIWSEVLGLDKVGVHDDFFDLGGHSLLATRVVSRLRSQFEIELPLRVLFESRELGSLAKYLEAVLWARETPGGAKVASATASPVAGNDESESELEAVEEWEL